jgi:hypothetical protein
MINLQKSVPTMNKYNNNDQIEREYTKTIPLQQPQKHQIPKNKLNKEWNCPLQELQTIEERDQRRLQKVERSPVLMNWKNQHSKKGSTTKSNQYVECHTHQNPNNIHYRD